MFEAHLCVERLDLRLCLRHRCSSGQSPDDGIAARAALLHLCIGKCQWLPNFSAPAELAAVAEIEKLKRKIESCGHDAHNGVAFAVEKQLRPDDLRVAIEPALPQTRTDDHDIVATKRAFFERRRIGLGAVKHRAEATRLP